jgi:hypothetical protein
VAVNSAAGWTVESNWCIWLSVFKVFGRIFDIVVCLTTVVVLPNPIQIALTTPLRRVSGKLTPLNLVIQAGF